jgi:hypothetical protein
MGDSHRSNRATVTPYVKNVCPCRIQAAVNNWGAVRPLDAKIRSLDAQSATQKIDWPKSGADNNGVDRGEIRFLYRRPDRAMTVIVGANPVAGDSVVCIGGMIYDECCRCQSTGYKSNEENPRGKPHYSDARHSHYLTNTILPVLATSCEISRQ